MELLEARILVGLLRSHQKRLGMTNRDFIHLINRKGGVINLRTYGNWLGANGNLPRPSASPMIRLVLKALDRMGRTKSSKAVQTATVAIETPPSPPVEVPQEPSTAIA